MSMMRKDGSWMMMVMSMMMMTIFDDDADVDDVKRWELDDEG